MAVIVIVGGDGVWFKKCQKTTFFYVSGSLIFDKKNFFLFCWLRYPITDL